MGSPIPVTLLTGFLGSGKTTFLNQLLKTGALDKAALVINEFGDVGIDHMLVETSDEAIVELSDGCLCCTIRGDLVDTLTRLLNYSDRGLDRIIIETTGLADPAPILHVIMGHPVLGEQLRLDGVLAVVDAVNGMATMDAHEEAVKQVAVADRLLIGKTDLADDCSDLIERLVRLNPIAQRLFLPTEAEDILDSVFGCGVYDPETKTADVKKWLDAEAVSSGHHHHHHHDVNRHDKRIRAFTLATDQSVDAPTLATFIDLLRSAHGPNLLRVKGIFRLSDDPERPLVVHGVQEIFHPPAQLPS